MKKLTIENLNEFIDSVRTEDSVIGVKLPRSVTYPDQVYIDMDKLIDKRDEFKDLFRQNLVAFSKIKTNLPRRFLFCTGERDSSGNFLKWTQNSDDISRFISMGMLSNLIVEADNKEVVINGKTEKGFFITLSNEEIRPVVVREEPKPMTKAKEPDAK